jgi:hypothetical protein
MNVETPDGKIIEFPDSMGAKEINAILDKQYGKKSAPPPTKSFISPLEGYEEPGAKLNFGEMLPLAGGLAGGVAKTLPRRTGLSALLAGGAEGYHQIIQHLMNSPDAPTSSIEALKRMALVGGEQGAGQVGGELLGKGISALIPKITRSPASGIPLTLGEKTDSGFLQKVEAINEKIPMSGMTRFRTMQNEATKNAGKEFLGKYTVAPTAETTAMMKEANETALDTLYEGVKAEGKKLPSVVPEKIRESTAALVERYPSVFESIQDTKIKKILKDITGDTKDASIKTGVLDASGKPITRTETPQFNFDDLWMLRKGIGRELKDARTETAKAELSSLYSAVSKDMDTMFSKSTTGIGKEFKNANEEFKRLNVKFDVIRQAYDKAAGTTSATEFFSPKTFSTQLKKLANDPTYKKNVKFGDQEVNEMTGLANIMQVAKRAGSFKENPATGDRYLSYIVVKDVLTKPLLPLAWTVTVLTTTKAGEAMVRAAAKLPPGSAAMTKIIERLYLMKPPEATQSQYLNPEGGSEPWKEIGGQ